MLTLPFFDKLQSCQTILLAGAGGGYDFFCGLPLYEMLRRAGKTVHLANLSFSDITGARGERLTPHLMEVTADSLGNENYFPELHFCRWMRGRGEEISVYAFEVTGVAPLRESYAVLIDHLKLDAIVLVDGGTDSLMRGDESGVGTPVEDVASILAVNAQNVPVKMLSCVGFGVDAFHGVCHAHYLEAVAQLIEKNAYLGCWSLMKETPEVEFYRQAAEFVFRKMPRQPSIVSTSVLAALEGHFGNYHTTSRTQGSKLFINPLMALVWCFGLEAVAERILYPQEMAQTQSANDIRRLIEQFRYYIPKRPYVDLPM